MLRISALALILAPALALPPGSASAQTKIEIVPNRSAFSIVTPPKKPFATAVAIGAPANPALANRAPALSSQDDIEVPEEHETPEGPANQNQPASASATPGASQPPGAARTPGAPPARGQARQQAPVEAGEEPQEKAEAPEGQPSTENTAAEAPAAEKPEG